MTTQISVKNHSQLNAMRVSFEDADISTKPVLDKHGKPTGEAQKVVRWKPAPVAPVVVPAGKTTDAYVAVGQRRIIVEELPT
jgi:hypothetical protein